MQRGNNNLGLFGHDYFSLHARYLSNSDVERLKTTCLAAEAAGNQYLENIFQSPVLLVQHLSKMNAVKMREFISLYFSAETANFLRLKTWFEKDKQDLYLAACYAIIGPAFDSHHLTLMDAHEKFKNDGYDVNSCLMQSLEFQAALCMGIPPHKIPVLKNRYPNAYYNLPVATPTPTLSLSLD